MLPELLQTTNLFSLLHRIDIDLAKQQQEAGCPFCGGRLHNSSYQRKPRGGPDNLPDEYLLRLSLCCSRENCRRRKLPPSTLFMGRRVFWGGVILVVLTLKHNSSEMSKANLMRLFKVKRQTINRWILYFREIFPVSRQWQLLRGMVSSSVRNSSLPGDLLNYFIQLNKNVETALVKCLRFLASAHFLTK